MVKKGSEVKSTKLKISPTKKKVAAKPTRKVAVESLPGVIDPPTVPPQVLSPYRTINRTLEEIAVADITHFTIIPDFVTTSIAKHPIIVRTPGRNDCVEAYDLVETAQTEGRTTILCEVEEITSHSNLEISFRKAGMRTLTRGGHYVYAEMLRIAKNLTEQVKASGEDLQLYGHGQRRYGEGFVNNREEDLRHLVSSRMGKDRDTYNMYILHSEYLSDDAIQDFITRKAPKDFFTNAQVEKRQIASKLIGERVEDPELTQQISTIMLQKFEEYLQQKEAGNRTNQQPVTPPTPNPEFSNNEDEAEDGEDEPDDAGNRPDDPNTATAGNTATPASPEEIPTVAIIKDTILGVSSRLSTRTQETESLDEIDALLDAELKILIRIKSDIRHLMAGESRA